MIPPPITFAILGCGRIAPHHAELLANGLIESAQLQCVCDILPEAAKKLGEKFNVPYYTDFGTMLAEADFDALSILTPSGLHAQHTIQAARAGKHIIVEKPMALTLNEADAMISACEEEGVRLFVVKQNRFNNPVQKLRTALEQNRFGKLTLGSVRLRWCRTQTYYDNDPWRGTWAVDGGVLANQAIHHIDLLQWMMGDVKSVYAKSNTALVDIEAEDTAVVLLTFENEALGLIEATSATRPDDLEGSLSILGEGGSVEIAGIAVNEMKTWHFAQTQKEDTDIFTSSVSVPDVYGFGHRAYYDDVLACLQGKHKALVDGNEGRKSLTLLIAIYASIEANREIHLATDPLTCRLGNA